ncbi:MAG: DUF5017 domain-containing protein [Bacteroidaceae bacterium]|nr:DUF5017 domain-containing protein [Bacteroidaceae bacterium]
MKKIHSFLLIAATAVGILTSCSDVPMPYDINAGGSNSFGKVLPYKNASLSTFTMYDLVAGYPAWSQGSSYTQATGYQTWDGASSKSNKEVKSYLISPPLNTTCESGKVRFSFDQTLRYTNNVSGWQDNHKIYISKDFDGNAKNFDQATWTLINFTPEASTYSDWTLYSSGYIKVPDDFVNHDSVYIAFYFYAPASASTTWELENFLIEEGEADNNGNGQEEEALGSKDAPLTVAEAKGKVGSKGYVAGYIVGYVDGQKLEEGAKFEAASQDETELLLADSPNETDVANVFPVQLPAGEIRTALNPKNQAVIGQKVTLYGSFENYFGVPGMKSTSWAEMSGQTYGTDPDASDEPVGTPTGSGTAEDPYNVAAVYAFAKAGNYSNSSPSAEIYVKGIVSKIGDLNTKYNELNYYISDDGTTAGQFYVYNGYGLNGEEITSADYLTVGDVVIICGKITTYNGTHEFTYGSKIVSINGTGGDNPTPPEPAEIKGDGTHANPYNVAGIIAYTKALNKDVNSTEKLFFEGIVSRIKEISTDFGNATFWISDDGTKNNEFYIFRCLGLDNNPISSTDEVKVGDKVVIYGNVVNYQGNTPETTQKEAYIYAINGIGENPEPQPQPTGNFTRTVETGGDGLPKLTITNNDLKAADWNPVTYDFKNLGLANKTVLSGSYEISGMTISFDKGTNTANAPTYFTNDNSTDVRIYANNNMVITGSHPIRKVEMTCSSIAAGPCVGNETMTFAADGNTLTICNASTTAGTQLRIQTITVYYGE